MEADPHVSLFLRPRWAAALAAAYPFYRPGWLVAEEAGSVRGVLLQVLDPSEEQFPFKGRTIFESMGGTLTHETLKANDLRDILERADD